MAQDLPESTHASEQVVREVLAWRSARLKRLTAPDSWLSLIGKHWLEAGANTAGSAPDSRVQLPEDVVPPRLGTFLVAEGKVSFEPAPGVALQLQAGSTEAERTVTESTELRSDAEGPPDRLILGSVSFEIMERSGVFALRTRDTESPARLAFPGIEYFPIDPTWRVRARLEPYEPHKPIELDYETGTPQLRLSPGALLFEHGGASYRLDPVFEGSRLFILFRDQTSGRESYGAGRFLYAALPQNGEVELDFNQAFSPPCAFTPHAACPLPPAQNRLPVRVEAGEKTPRDP